MCAPCKIIINEESEGSSCRATTIADFMMKADRDDLPPPNDDDDLFELAKSEVEFIENVRRSGVAMAYKVGASKRWIDLMERL